MSIKKPLNSGLNGHFLKNLLLFKMQNRMPH